jgi:hypothetical protein
VTELTGVQREIVEILHKNGTPLTRANYVGLIWNDDPPKDWGAEEEAALPDFLQGAPDHRAFSYRKAVDGELERAP